MSKSDFVRAFTDITACVPDKMAVEAADGRLTYAELDALSSRLANRLAKMGVGREVRVAVSLPRGLAELLSLLATARAGGAYVPLDPAHPLERLTQILEDAAPQLLLTYATSPLLSVVSPSCKVVLLDDIGAAVEGVTPQHPAADFLPDQLAYILFTSGSTGRPKGIEITRGAFSNFLSSMAHTPGMAQEDRLLAVTTTSFDIAGLEYFLPLCVGATVVIADRNTAKDPRLLMSKIATDAITVMQATPASWRMLLDSGWRNEGAIRVLCGGEALSPELADRLLGGGGSIWNLYGPTETTVWSSVGRIQRGDNQITIGTPIDNTQIYILDANLKRVPRGAEGEICIGGDGLARGYRGRADLTAEKFVANPYSARGDRIYRTGDLGRQLSDGRFECLGRLDHQVKIRGFRVELGEIESVLRSVVGIEEALVTVDRQSEANPRLIAYWTGSTEQGSLELACGRKLPDFMHPAQYVHLAVFPLNTNGKIDRKQLPLPVPAETGVAKALRPRSDTEMRVAAVFRDMLGIGEVQIDRDFFTLGGNSLLAAQAITRLEQELAVELPLQAIFNNPTIARLAAAVSERILPDSPIVVCLRPGTPAAPPLFCLLGIQIYHSLAVSIADDRQVIAIHVPIRYAPGLSRAPGLSDIALRYVDIIRRHQPAGPYNLLGLCFGGVVAYQVAAELEALGETVATVAVLDAVLPNALHFNARKYVLDKISKLGRKGRRAIAVFVSTGRSRLSAKLQRWNHPSLMGRGAKLLALCFGGFAAELDALGESVAVLPSAAYANAGKYVLEKISRFKTKLHRFLQEPIHRSAEIVDYSVNGRDAALEVATFAKRSGAIEATLIVVKATDEATPTWMKVEHGYGWIGRAKHVIVHEVKGDHLAILREPHVTALAEVICKHQLAESAGNRSSVRSTSSTSTAKSCSTLVPTTNPKY